MKKYILFIAILFFLFGCNNTEVTPDPEPLPGTDTSKTEIDTVNTGKKDIGLGIGLTLEEMKDDSVFTDGSVPTSWEVAGITDVKAFKLFLKKLQLLVLNNDKEQVAKLIKYPLGKSIKTEKDFINNYDMIFSKDARLSIANINLSQVFRNSKGAMTEGGKVWFTQEGNEFKIIAINK